MAKVCIEWRWKGWIQWNYGYVDEDALKLDWFEISEYKNGKRAFRALKSQVEWRPYEENAERVTGGSPESAGGSNEGTEAGPIGIDQGVATP